MSSNQLSFLSCFLVVDLSFNIRYITFMGNQFYIDIWSSKSRGSVDQHIIESSSVDQHITDPFLGGPQWVLTQYSSYDTNKYHKSLVSVMERPLCFFLLLVRHLILFSSDLTSLPAFRTRTQGVGNVLQYPWPLYMLWKRDITYNESKTLDITSNLAFYNAFLLGFSFLTYNF